MRKLIVLPLCVAIAGCATASTVPKPCGSAYDIIGCGTAAPVRICNERANKECPAGYKVVTQDNDGVRKELTIDCDK